MFPRPDFFQGAELNFARNLLYPIVPQGFEAIGDNDIAIVSATEAAHQEMTWGELRTEVRKCANALRPYLEVGDRVAGFLGNHALTVVAMLAATSLGAIVGSSFWCFHLPIPNPLHLMHTRGPQSKL
jgi:acetoacetyl-CoA synthetase